MRGSLGNRGDSGEQWRAVASRGEQGSKQCGAPDFFDGLGPWACQEAAGWEKLAKNSQAGPGGGCVTEAAIGTRSLVTGVKFFHGLTHLGERTTPGHEAGPVGQNTQLTTRGSRTNTLHSSSTRAAPAPHTTRPAQPLT